MLPPDNGAEASEHSHSITSASCAPVVQRLKSAFGFSARFRGVSTILTTTSFARTPAEITVLELVELLDGPLGADAKGVFGDAATAARDVLAKTTVQDVIEREARESGSAMYHI